MTQEQRDRIKDQINHDISVLEKSIDTLSELINGEVQSDANDWFTYKESNQRHVVCLAVIEKNVRL
jgi:hypothetical protein